MTLLEHIQSIATRHEKFVLCENGSTFDSPIPLREFDTPQSAQQALDERNTATHFVIAPRDFHWWRWVKWVKFHDPDRPDELLKLHLNDRCLQGWSSIKGAELTRQALIAKFGLRPCKHCIIHFSERTNENGQCHSCNYWQRMLEPENPHKFIIDGTHYTDAGESSERPAFLGHAGNRFRWLDLRDNTTHTTNNLWCQGKVPAIFNPRDTAKWLEKERYEAETKS